MKQHRTFRRATTIGFWFLFALSLGLFPAASPGSAADPVRTITLEDALQITLEHNRDIQKAKEFQNKVMGIYVEQRAYALPQLTATGTVGRSWDEALAKVQSANLPPSIKGQPPNNQDKAVGVTLTQPLYTWGQIGAAIKAADFGIASAADQLRLFRQAALRDVSSAFYDVLLSKEFHSIALQNLQQKTAHLDEARRKFGLGVATEYDVLAAGVAVENARPDAIRTENLIRTSRERVRFFLGIPEEIDVTGSLEASLKAVPAFDETLGVAYGRRPELADLRDRLGFSRELVKVAQAGDKPRVDLRATAGYRALAPGYSPDLDGKTWSVGVAITFPFFDGFRTKGRVAQAKSDVSSLKIEEAKALDSIALQVRDAINAVNEAGGIVHALSGTVSQAERLLQMAEKGYEYGVKTRLDVDDAELNLTRARGNLAQAKRNYLVAKLTLTWAMGILGEGEPPSR